MTDNNGSIVVEYDYDAYGNLTRKVGDADNNYLFAGEQFDDAVDGYYNRARYYDPNTGRFASVDPFAGYNNQPITLHDYLYAGSNPIIYIDPSGNIFLSGNGWQQFNWDLDKEFSTQIGKFISDFAGLTFATIEVFFETITDDNAVTLDSEGNIRFTEEQLKQRQDQQAQKISEKIWEDVEIYLELIFGGTENIFKFVDSGLGDVRSFLEERSLTSIFNDTKKTYGKGLEKAVGGEFENRLFVDPVKSLIEKVPLPFS